MNQGLVPRDFLKQFQWVFTGRIVDGAWLMANSE
jgi:hypothetical protein